MALMNSNELKKYGTHDDICEICLKKKVESGSEIVAAKKELRGHLENKKILRLRKNGIDLCFCKNCLEEMIETLD